MVRELSAVRGPITPEKSTGIYRKMVVSEDAGRQKMPNVACNAQSGVSGGPVGACVPRRGDIISGFRQPALAEIGSDTVGRIRISFAFG